MRIANGRWPVPAVVLTVATGRVVAGLLAAVGPQSARMLAGAALGGMAAAIAGPVQASANRGLATGKELLTGANPPITASVGYPAAAAELHRRFQC